MKYENQIYQNSKIMKRDELFSVMKYENQISRGWNMNCDEIWEPDLTRYQDDEIWSNVTSTQVH